jgi:hypothetical protein
LEELLNNLVVRKMKKFLKIITIIAITLIPMFIGSKVFAQETTQQNCISLEELYSNLEEESQSQTGDAQSYDLVKKKNIASKLVLIIESLAGEKAICDNEGNPSGEDGGVVSFFFDTTDQMFQSYPSNSLYTAIKQEFSPENSTVSVFADGEENDPDNLKKTDKLFNKIGEMGIDTSQSASWCPGNSCTCDDAYSTCVISTRDYGDEPGTCACVDGGQVYMKDVIVTDKDEQTGYEYLQSMGLAKLWSFVRNVAYIGFTIVMIVIGFMIMFRKKLGGKVVVGLNNTLPQVILGLVLATFSFAIVGIMLDAGKLVMNVSESYIRSGFGEELEDIKIIPLGSITDYSNSAISTHMEYRKEVIPSILTRPFITALSGAIGGGDEEKTNVMLFYGQMMKQLVGNIFATAIINWDISASMGGEFIAEALDISLDVVFTAYQIATIPQLIVLILVLVLSLYAGFRLFLTMLLLYGKIFLDTITAPIVMLTGSFPGNSNQMMNWFKKIAAEVLSFPIIFLIINLVRYIALSGVIDTKGLNFFGNTSMAWPNWIVPLEFVIVIFGYLLAANIPKTINKMFKVGESKEMAGAMQDTMKSASKIPLIGGLFK